MLYILAYYAMNGNSMLGFIMIFRSHYALSAKQNLTYVYSFRYGRILM